MLLENVELFHGETTESAARVYARLPSVPEAAGLSLAGQLYGPLCQDSRTLPATVKFRDLGPGESLLACVTLPDPCYWSSELPAVYRASLELRQDGQAIETCQRTIGIRSLGASEKDVFRAGERWVLRAAEERLNPWAETALWKEAPLTRLVESPSEELLQNATQEGSPLAVWVRGEGEAIAQQLRRLARWAAVGWALIDSTEDADWRQAAPNILLLQYAPAGQKFRPTRWAQGVVAEEDGQEDFASRILSYGLPAMAMRRSPEELSPLQARQACEYLQRDLAPQGADLAGYIVGKCS